MKGAKLLGFQFADATGNNIAGDDNDPSGLASFEIMEPELAASICSGMGLRGETNGFFLQPIYEGMIEEPTIITMKRFLYLKTGRPE